MSDELRELYACAAELKRTADDLSAFIDTTMATADRYAYDANTDPVIKKLLLDLITIILQIDPSSEEQPE